MINRVEFRNYKALREVAVNLPQFSVIVGPNSSGKSSILLGIYDLCRAIWTDERQVFHPFQLQMAYSRGGVGDFEICCRSDAQQVRVRATPPESLPTYNVLRSVTQDMLNDWRLRFERFEQRTGWQDVAESDRPNLTAFQCHFAQLNATKLASSSHSDKPVPGVAVDGEGLATTLAYIALNQPESFQAIQEQLRAIVPSVKRLRFDKIAQSKIEHEYLTIDGTEVPRNITRNFIDDLIIFDFVSVSDVPSWMVSEGTMIALGILAILNGPMRPNLLLVDDLERGLHPHAQLNLVRVLQKILKENSGLQIVATTHSPFILDPLTPDEILMVSTDVNGATRCMYLSEHPMTEQWRSEMTPGEIWTFVDRNWGAMAVPVMEAKP